MKKLSALLCAAMLLMLCACGTPQDGQSAGTETVPDECRFYYDTPELEVIADRSQARRQRHDKRYNEIEKRRPKASFLIQGICIQGKQPVNGHF